MITPRPLARLRNLCLDFAEVREQLSHGEPTVFVKKRVFAMFANADNHHGAGRHAVWVKAAPGRQARAVKTKPLQYFVPPYVGPSGWVGVWLDAPCDWSELGDILRDGYRLVAGKKLQARLDAATRS